MRNGLRDQLLSSALVWITAVLVCTPQSPAQAVAGRILGTVRDQQGAVVPNA